MALSFCVISSLYADDVPRFTVVGQDGPVSFDVGEISRLEEKVWSWQIDPQKNLIRYTRFRSYIMHKGRQTYYDYPDWYLTLYKTHSYNPETGEYEKITDLVRHAISGNQSPMTIRDKDLIYELKQALKNRTEEDKPGCYKWQLKLKESASGEPVYIEEKEFKIRPGDYEAFIDTNTPPDDPGGDDDPSLTEGFFQNLFVPDQEHVESLRDHIGIWQKFAPVAIIHDIREALSDRQDRFGDVIEGRRILDWGSIWYKGIHYKFHMDITDYMPYLIWVRRCFAAGMWITLAFAIWRRVGRSLA